MRHTGNVGLLYWQRGPCADPSAAYRAPMLKDLGDSHEDVWYESEWHVDFPRVTSLGDEIVVNQQPDKRASAKLRQPIRRQAKGWRERESMVAPGIGLHWSL